MSKELLRALDEKGLLEYGSVILASTVREILGIELPPVGTKATFDRLALMELGAIDYVRKILLGHGKYLAGHQGDYRILLPSENKRQVDHYMHQADNKLRRALQLSKNTPKPDTYQPDNTTARIVLKRESIRSSTRNQDHRL